MGTYVATIWKTSSILRWLLLAGILISSLSYDVEPLTAASDLNSCNSSQYKILFVCKEYNTKERPNDAANHAIYLHIYSTFSKISINQQSKHRPILRPRT